jgi:hypothetical protein
LNYVGQKLAAFLFGPIQIISGLIILYVAIDLAFLSVIGIVIFLLVAGYLLSRINIKINDENLKTKD